MENDRYQDEPEAGEASAQTAANTATPGSGTTTLNVVGIGGSAGGLPALTQFLKAMQPNPGAAIVVVFHLLPDGESQLANLLQTMTPLRVMQVSQTERLQADVVYVIPPGKVMKCSDGHLILTALPAPRGAHTTVDVFFRSLAESHGIHAAAIVLSGANSDGASGIKRIKERGGLTLAQEPAEAEHEEMPRRAIATGMVDWVLPAAEMPERLATYFSGSRWVDVGVASSQRGFDIQGVQDGYDALTSLLSLLRSRTGRDFSYYKRATILRRIARRMQVNNVEALSAYLQVVQTCGGEVGALAQELLISVTNFFRDQHCFDALVSHIPSLFNGKSSADTVRVWIPACATGEEAYSVAMLLMEHAQSIDGPPVIQVFATDLDRDAVRVAREGLYPQSIETDVNAERLNRFFVKESQGLRVRRELRESVLFAVHDVLSDSPFSHLDLVCCRNLMIYLTKRAQSRLLDIFHYALQPQGLLLLGSSETLNESAQQFRALDKKSRIFARLGPPKARLPTPKRYETHAVSLTQQSEIAEMFEPEALVAGSVSFNASDIAPDRSWGDLHWELIEALAPPSILVNADNDVLHLTKSAGMFLHHAGGEPSRNLFRMIQPDLHLELRAALFHAAKHREEVIVPPVVFTLQERATVASMRVAPAGMPGFDLFIIFIATRDATPKSLEASSAVEFQTGKGLGLELERLKLHLRETIEQYETSGEELKAGNEELQAVNEELRSATEELDTGREDLQSLNEELITTNQELKAKVNLLSGANSDMRNLIDATEIATIFLDRELCITRYTPCAVALFNLIANDVGRPLADLQTSIQYADLCVDAQRVLADLTPVEHEVPGCAGRWFVVRIRPYRTLDDHIAGVVITFMDITAHRRGQEQLRASEARYSAIVKEATMGFVQIDVEGTIIFANPCFAAFLECTTAALIGRKMGDFVYDDDRPALIAFFETLLFNRQAMQIESRCMSGTGRTLWLFASANVLEDAAGGVDSILIVCNDVTARKEAEVALQNSEDRLRLVIESAREYAIFSTDLNRRVISWNTGAQRLLGYEPNEILGKMADIIFTEEDRQQAVPLQETQLALRRETAPDERMHVKKNGHRFWASGAMMPMHDAAGNAIGFVKVLRDQSNELAARRALEQSEAELVQALDAKEAALTAIEEANASKDRFLAVLSHELRNPLAAIHSAGERLEGSLVRESPEARMASVVSRQSRSMKVLLEDLLDMSRLQLGKFALRRAWHPLGDVVDTAVEAARPAIDAAGHAVTIHVSERALPLFVDHVRLSQVLTNLLGNAAKYTPRQGQITLTASVSDTEVTFEVRDDGIGMDPATVDSMFEMFRQAPVKGRPLMGMGIGLALARAIVESHGGTILGTSEGIGLGSKFVVTVPCVDGQLSSEEEAIAATRSAGSRHSPGPMRIMVVDDNVDAAWLTSELLAEQGHEIRTANDGKSALDIAREFAPQIMFLDLGMPGIDGYEVARRLRGYPEGRCISIVATTGWGQQEDRQRTADAGFDMHLTKPISSGELLRAIKQLGG